MISIVTAGNIIILILNYKYPNLIYYLLILDQIRLICYIYLYIDNGIDERQLQNICSRIVSIMVSFFINLFFLDVFQKKYKILTNLIWSIVFLASTWGVIYEKSQFFENRQQIIDNSLYVLLIISVYSYLVGAIKNINNEMIKDYFEMNQKIITKNAIQRDQINIFQQIQSSLLTFQKKNQEIQVTFINDQIQKLVFGILDSNNLDQTKYQEILDFKIFKIFREDEKSSQQNTLSPADHSPMIDSNQIIQLNNSPNPTQMLSLRSIIEQSSSNFEYLSDKIFEVHKVNELKIKNDSQSSNKIESYKIRYVNISISKLQKQQVESQINQDFSVEEISYDEFILQVNDLSDKILYNEVQAEKKFHTLVSAQVSHELRNPLNSLICQLQVLNNGFEEIFEMIQQIEEQIIMLEKNNINQISDQNLQFLRFLKMKLQQSFYKMILSGKKITSSAQLIDYFIHDMLDYSILNGKSKIFMKNIKCFNLKKCMSQILSIMADKIKMKNIKLKLCYKGFQKNEIEPIKQYEFNDSDQYSSNEIEDSQFMIKSDEKRIQQVFLNVLANALKFTDKNGKINVEVELIRKKNQQIGIMQNLQSQNYQLQISVQDNGIGIKKKDQKKIFRLFGSIKDEKKKINTNGIGIGLVLSKLIVEKFDGKIDFISEFQKGTTFFMTFDIEILEEKDILLDQFQNTDDSKNEIIPQFKINDYIQKYQNVRKSICKEMMQFKSTKQQSVENILQSYENILKLGNRRVLVIDDEEFTLSALDSILRILKVNVDEKVDFAMSGKEALELVEKLQLHNIRYCLILTDIQMPGLNGIETAKLIRKFYIQSAGLSEDLLPVIYGVSGHTEDEFKIQAKKNGIKDILEKPLYLQRLKQVLQEVQAL